LSVLRSREPRGRALLPPLRHGARAVRPSRGAARRQRALRRHRRLHVALRAARPGGRPRVPDAVLRARPARDRGARRPDREVRRRRGARHLRRAGRARRRRRARRADRPRDPRLADRDERRRPGARPPGPARREHRRGDRRPRRTAGSRRLDGRGRRHQHGGAPAVGRADERGARRPRHLRVDADRGGVRARAAGHRQGEGGAGRCVAGTPRGCTRRPADARTS
jgi:hypothetical protein